MCSVAQGMVVADALLIEVTAAPPDRKCDQGEPPVCAIPKEPDKAMAGSGNAANVVQRKSKAAKTHRWEQLARHSANCV